ncbi:MAG: right-handed parallel beta-helix repeat-containing protein [Candidatus Omnitrophota bacterium]
MRIPSLVWLVLSGLLILDISVLSSEAIRSHSNATPVVAGVEKKTTLTFYVSPVGDDGWSGKITQPDQVRKDGPFASVARARDAIRQIKAAGQLSQPIAVQIRGGLYNLREPLVFTPQDSGTAQTPIIYEAYPNEVPVLSGGRVITGWEHGQGDVWTAQVPAVKEGSWYFHQLFVNGLRRQRVRLPHTGFFYVDGQLSAGHNPSFRFRSGDIRSSWAQDSDVEVVALDKWMDLRAKIVSVNGNRVMLSGTRHPLFNGQDVRYWIENNPDQPEAPGEWYLSRQQGMVYYHPLPDEDLKNSQVIAPALEQIIRFDGNPDDNVHDIILRGLVISYADWSLPLQMNGPFIQADVELSAAVEAKGARSCTIEKCVFSHLGQYAVAFGKGSKDNLIVANEMTDLGAGGVKIGDARSGVYPRRHPGQTGRVPESRFPLDSSQYNARPDYPHSEAETSSNNVVSDNHIHDIGVTFPSGVGIWVGQSHDNMISHNEIYDTYYSGISCGWTWGFGPTAARANVIEFNHIYNIGRGLLSDMGAIYTLGVQPGTVIFNNVLHDVHRYDGQGGYGGWGIYLDAASSEILAENNIIYHTEDGSLHQNSGQHNTIRNNIFALNRVAQIQRSHAAPEQSFAFQRNIVYWKEGDLLRTRLSEGGLFFDYNLYYNTAGNPVQLGTSRFGEISWVQWQADGQDLHSIIADPRFVDPEHGNFALAPGSPAYKIGFQAIETSQVGPRKSKLPLENSKRSEVRLDNCKGMF